MSDAVPEDFASLFGHRVRDQGWGENWNELQCKRNIFKNIQKTDVTIRKAQLHQSNGLGMDAKDKKKRLFLKLRWVKMDDQRRVKTDA